MKVIFLVLLFVAITGNFVIPQEKNSSEITNGIQLIISTDKSDYLEGENVWLEWKFIADKNVKLDFWPGGYREFVTNSKNQQLPNINYTPECILGHTYEYPDTISSFYVLEFGYYELPKPREIYQVGYYYPADVYEINAYINVMIKGKEYKVEAKPVKFFIRKPEGEDFLARNEYLEMFPLLWKDSSYWKDTNAYKSLTEFKENYEKNPLLEQDTNAYKSYIRLKEYLEMVSKLWKDTTDYKLLLQEKIDSFFVKYENSVYIDKVLYSIGAPRKSISAIEFYYNLILKHPEFAGNYHRLNKIMRIYNDENDSSGYLSMIYDLESRLKDNEIFKKVLYYHKRIYQMELSQGLFK